MLLLLLLLLLLLFGLIWFRLVSVGLAAVAEALAERSEVRACSFKCYKTFARTLPLISITRSFIKAQCEREMLYLKLSRLIIS